MLKKQYFTVITIMLVMLTGFLQAQQPVIKLPDTKMLEKSIKDLDRALVNRDSVIINRHLHDKVTYGHSNGWVETKEEVVADLYNGKLLYLYIIPKDQAITIDGTTAVVRTNTSIETYMQGKSQEYKLKVLQVWVWNNKQWQLLARQSAQLK